MEAGDFICCALQRKTNSKVAQAKAKTLLWFRKEMTLISDFFPSPVNAVWFLVCWLLNSCKQLSKVNNTNIILRHAIPPKCCQDQREHLFFVFLSTFLWCIFAHDKQTRLDFFFPPVHWRFFGPVLWHCCSRWDVFGVIFISFKQNQILVWLWINENNNNHRKALWNTCKRFLWCPRLCLDERSASCLCAVRKEWFSPWL